MKSPTPKKFFGLWFAILYFHMVLWARMADWKPWEDVAWIPNR